MGTTEERHKREADAERRFVGAVWETIARVADGVTPDEEDRAVLAEAQRRLREAR